MRNSFFGKGRVCYFVRKTIPPAQPSVPAQAASNGDVSKDDVQQSTSVVKNPVIKTFRCPICPRTYLLSEAMLELHVTFHREGEPTRNLFCPICGKMKIAWTTILKHYVCHSEIKANASLYEMVLTTCDQERKRCGQCNTTFELRSDLIHHLQKTHVGEKVKESSETSSEESKQMKYPSSSSLQQSSSQVCPKLNGYTVSISILKGDNQIPAGGNTTTDPSNSVLKGNGESAPVKTLKNSLASCLKRKLQDAIEKGSKKDKTLLYTVTVTTDAPKNVAPEVKNEIYSCSNCSYKTKYQNNLERHSQDCKDKRKTTDDEYPNFLEDVVKQPDPEQKLRSVLFYVPPALNSKFKSYRHQCDYCPERFQKVSQLNCHLMTHREDAMFHCKACKYKCLQKKNMQRHVYSVHPTLAMKGLIVPPKTPESFPGIHKKVPMQKKTDEYCSESESSSDDNAS